MGDGDMFCGEAAVGFWDGDGWWSGNHDRQKAEEYVDEHTVRTDVYHWASVGLQVRYRLLIHNGGNKLPLCTITILLIHGPHSEGFAQKGEASQ